jgi:hypothetical protein
LAVAPGCWRDRRPNHDSFWYDRRAGPDQSAPPITGFIGPSEPDRAGRAATVPPGCGMAVGINPSDDRARRFYDGLAIPSSLTGEGWHGRSGSE